MPAQYEILQYNISDLTQNTLHGEYFDFILATTGVLSFGIAEVWAWSMLYNQPRTFAIAISLLTHDYQASPKVIENGSKHQQLSALINSVFKNKSDPGLPKTSHAFDACQQIYIFLNRILFTQYHHYRSLNKLFPTIFPDKKPHQAFMQLHNACYCGDRIYYDGILPKIFSHITTQLKRDKPTEPIVWIVSTLELSMAFYISDDKLIWYDSLALSQMGEITGINQQELVAKIVDYILKRLLLPGQIYALNIRAFSKVDSTKEPSASYYVHPSVERLNYTDLAHKLVRKYQLPGHLGRINNQEEYFKFILDTYLANRRLQSQRQSFLYELDQLWNHYNTQYHEINLTEIIHNNKHLCTSQPNFLLLVVRHCNISTLIRLLLLRDEQDIQITLQTKQELLLLALFGFYDNSILELIYRTRGRIYLREPIRHGNNLLHLACRWGHLQAVEFLLTKNPSLYNTRTQTENSYLPIHIAAIYGWQEIVSRLMDYPYQDADLKLLAKLQKAYLEQNSIMGS